MQAVTTHIPLPALTDNYAVFPESNIFKINPHLERLQKICRVAWNVFSIIVFPIGLARLLINTTAKLIILPAANHYDINDKNNHLAILQKRHELAPSSALEEKIKLAQAAVNELNALLDAKREFCSIATNHAKQVSVTTADGVQLDTMIIQNQNQLELPPEKQKWIVFCSPNMACYEELLSYLKAISDATGASVYTGNYRGIMQSSGSCSSTHDLVLDGEAMVQKLLSAGIPAENIMMHGWSLGGALASEVVSHHQEKDHEMSVCNDRSFGSLISASAALIPYFGGLLGRIAWLAGWKFNSVQNMHNIKPEQRLAIVGKNDEVIKYPASVLKCFKKSYPKETLRGIKIESKNVHGIPLDWHKPLLDLYAAEVKRMLKMA